MNIGSGRVAVAIAQSTTANMNDGSRRFVATTT